MWGFVLLPYSYIAETAANRVLAVCGSERDGFAVVIVFTLTVWEIFLVPVDVFLNSDLVVGAIVALG